MDGGEDDLGVGSTVSIGRRSCGAGGCRDRRTMGLLLREVGRAPLLHLCTLSTLLDNTYRTIEFKLFLSHFIGFENSPRLLNGSHSSWSTGMGHFCPYSG